VNGGSAAIFPVERLLVLTTRGRRGAVGACLWRAARYSARKEDDNAAAAAAAASERAAVLDQRRVSGWLSVRAALRLLRVFATSNHTCRESVISRVFNRRCLILS